MIRITLNINIDHVTSAALRTLRVASRFDGKFVRAN